MLNKYEQELYEELRARDYSHEYLIQELDIMPGHPLYADYYNPTVKGEERYLIIEVEKDKKWKLVDACVRNDFYGCFFWTNSYELALKERDKLIKINKPILYEQLSLF